MRENAVFLLPPHTILNYLTYSYYNILTPSLLYNYQACLQIYKFDNLYELFVYYLGHAVPTWAPVAHSIDSGHLEWWVCFILRVVRSLEISLYSRPHEFTDITFPPLPLYQPCACLVNLHIPCHVIGIMVFHQSTVKQCEELWALREMDKIHVSSYLPSDNIELLWTKTHIETSEWYKMIIVDCV